MLMLEMMCECVVRDSYTLHAPPPNTTIPHRYWILENTYFPMASLSASCDRASSMVSLAPFSCRLACCVW